VTPIVVTTYSTTGTNNDGFQNIAGVTGSLTYNISGGQSVNGDYNVTLNPVFNTTPSALLNSTVGAGGYQLNSGGDFFGLQSGWYQLNVSDNVCGYSQNIYIPHLFDSSVNVTNYGSGKLDASVSNPADFSWFNIKWSDGAQTSCLTLPCGTTSLISNTHPSGTDLTLEVVWVFTALPNQTALWRTFKRKYKVP
jgi:hypothetical protein